MEALLNDLAVILTDDSTLRQLIVWLSAGASVVMVLGAAAITMSVFDPVRRRVGNLSGEKPENRRLMLKVATAMGPVAAFVLPQQELERHKIVMQLSRAGFRSPTALQAFYFIKTMLIIVAPLAVLIGSNWIPQIETVRVLTYAMFASGVGMFAPNVVLQRLVDKRARALSNGFPDALDLLVVCVESGLGLASAIQRVADELDVSHPELAFELSIVNAEIRVGVQREQALKNLANRTGLEDIRGLVGLLVQTMRFGTGVADALRVYSEEFRDKRMQKAEEQAAKMGTMLVFPLVLFMFPIFFIVAIGPAVIRIIDAFSQI
ncbi:MAG TPA: type II secretion system F family protein [Woeseiaceae bacterium]|jgi:tight adherence protein C